MTNGTPFFIQLLKQEALRQSETGFLFFSVVSCGTPAPRNLRQMKNNTAAIRMSATTNANKSYCV